MGEQVKKYVNDAAEEIKGWEHDDFAEGRKSMRLLLFCLKKSDIACVREVYAIDLINLCIFEYVMANCLSYEEIEFRLEDFTFSNDMLFGVKLGRRIAEVYDVLVKTVEEGVRYTPTGVLLHPSKEIVPIVRLLENTRRQDKLAMWPCDHLWALAMRLSTRVFLIDEIERVDITKEEVFVRFDSELIRPMSHGGRLWPISPKSAVANRKLFIAMRDTPGMKKKFPQAAYAIRILEVARMSGRDRGQDPRDWYGDYGRECNNGKQPWREDEDRSERGRGNERRHDSPEQYGRRYERDDGRYGGQKDWYAGHSSAFGGDEGGWQQRDERQQRDWSRGRDGTGYSSGDRRDRSSGSGYSSRDWHGDVRRVDSGGQRPQHSSNEQYEQSHEPRPYGNPGNSQWREGNDGRHDNPRNVQQRHGTSVDRKVHEEVGRAAGAKEHAGREPQHAVNEQHAELLRMQAAGEKERARRVREGEEARAAVIREQEQRQKLSQDVAVKMASGVTIQDDEHFPKTRKEVRLLAYVCTRARTKDAKGGDGKVKEGTLLLPEGDHGDIFERMLSFFTRDPDFISVDATYKKLKTGAREP
eukprot:jgi/Chrpa1/18043/Chrysochromulina_OHIO_Genome00024537-RA